MQPSSTARPKRSKNTIRRAEAAEGIPGVRADNLAALQRALEAGGILFLDAGDVRTGGPGVRMRGGPSGWPTQVHRAARTAMVAPASGRRDDWGGRLSSGPADPPRALSPGDDHIHTGRRQAGRASRARGPGAVAHGHLGGIRLDLTLASLHHTINRRGQARRSQRHRRLAVGFHRRGCLAARGSSSAHEKRRLQSIDREPRSFCFTGAFSRDLCPANVGQLICYNNRRGSGIPEHSTELYSLRI
jgi:hypothetical protein